MGRKIFTSIIRHGAFLGGSEWLDAEAPFHLLEYRDSRTSYKIMFDMLIFQEKILQ